MIHYNVWFSFKAGVDEGQELTRIASFLDRLKSQALIDDFKLLRGRAAETRLPPFQALILFRDNEQFGRPFEQVAAIGARVGEHGLMIANIDAFMADTFEELSLGESSQ